MIKVLPLLVMTLFSLISSPAVHAGFQSSDLRQEFESTFDQLQIYRAIKKHLPQEYEKLFQDYRRFLKENPDGSFSPAQFVASIKSKYFQQASDQAIHEYYRYITETGRMIFSKNPEAGFAYLFGGTPDAYSPYLDIGIELEQMGRLYEKLLSTLSTGNLAGLDRKEANLRLDFVFLELYYGYGEDLLLLGRKDLQNFTADEKSRICDIYLNMHERILALETPARNHVLRTMAMNP